jgi:predicted aconitase
VPRRLLRDTVIGSVLGHVVGKRAGALVPAIVGLPEGTTEDTLKALGAAAASSGAVAMFHAVGLTPEAPTLDASTGGAEIELETAITGGDLRAARDELTTAGGAAIGAVSVGTPHASIGELERIASLVSEASLSVPFYVNAGRDTLEEAGRRGLPSLLEHAGVTLVTDTCTYITPIIERTAGPVMTDSAKWAWYAPGNLGLDTILGSLEECVRSAAAGRVVRDPDLWGGP